MPDDDAGEQEQQRRLRQRRDAIRTCRGRIGVPRRRAFRKCARRHRSARWRQGRSANVRLRTESRASRSARRSPLWRRSAPRRLRSTSARLVLFRSAFRNDLQAGTELGAREGPPRDMAKAGNKPDRMLGRCGAAAVNGPRPPVARWKALTHQTSRCGICEQICCIKVGSCAAVGVFSAVPLPRINVASQAASLLLVP